MILIMVHYANGHLAFAVRRDTTSLLTGVEANKIFYAAHKKRIFLC
jgi:hypothetical protein